jgi:uncharacterized protein (DUF1330 family)
MPAYLVSDVTVGNAEAFETYRTRAAKAIAQYGNAILCAAAISKCSKGNGSVVCSL